MKQYDKIFVSISGHRRDGHAVFHWSNPEKLVSQVEQKENVIVLTMEELKEMWNTALGWGPEVKDFNDPSYTFDQFLQSKGISGH